MKHKFSKIFISAVTMIALSLFVCISPFALSQPFVTDLGNGFTRITFPNGVIRDLITDEIASDGIVIHSDGTVSVSFNRPSTQWNYYTYIVFSSSGSYDAVLSQLRNPNYTARNDRLLWRQSNLLRSKLGQLSLDVIKTTYPPPTSSDPIGTEKLYNFFLSDAIISQGSYLGEPYTLYEFSDIARAINIGGDDSGNVPEDTTNFYFDFKLRFEDMNVNVLQGYNICREIALKTNFSIIARDYNNQSFAFPMYDYEINVQSSDGKTYNLYYSDNVTAGEANEDIDILRDTDFNWSAGSFFSVRFYITPYGNVPFIPDFQPDSFVLRMFLYDKGHICLESPNVSTSVNTSIVNYRLRDKIILENDILERFKNQLIDDGIISLDTGFDTGFNVDNTIVETIYKPRGKVHVIVSMLMLTSASIALIGFALVGKKG